MDFPSCFFPSPSGRSTGGFRASGSSQGWGPAGGISRGRSFRKEEKRISALIRGGWGTRKDVSRLRFAAFLSPEIPEPFLPGRRVPAEVIDR